MANHGLAWIGLLAGAKLWHIAPHDGTDRRPPNPTCADRDAIEELPWEVSTVQ